MRGVAGVALMTEGSGRQGLAGAPHFLRLLDRARSQGPVTVSIAGAADEDILAGVWDAVHEGLARPILVGDEAATREAAGRAGFDDREARIVHATDARRASIEATRLVRDGEAEVLVKGTVPSGDFLRAILDPEHGLRTGRILSHVAIYDLPGYDRLVFMTDGGMIPAPDLAKKRQILHNALELARRLGVERPRVAALACTEKVDPHIQATVDAAALAEMAARGEFGDAIVEGPLALDMAFSAEMARKKGIASRIAGACDIWLAPDINAGNILGKSLLYLGGATMAGVVVGAAAPALLNTRVDTPAGKLASLAVAALLAPALRAERRA